MARLPTCRPWLLLLLALLGARAASARDEPTVSEVNDSTGQTLATRKLQTWRPPPPSDGCPQSGGSGRRLLHWRPPPPCKRPPPPKPPPPSPPPPNDGCPGIGSGRRLLHWRPPPPCKRPPPPKPPSPPPPLPPSPSPPKPPSPSPPLPPSPSPPKPPSPSPPLPPSPSPPKPPSPSPPLPPSPSPPKPPSPSPPLPPSPSPPKPPSPSPPKPPSPSPPKPPSPSPPKPPSPSPPLPPSPSPPKPPSPSPPKPPSPSPPKPPSPSPPPPPSPSPPKPPSPSPPPPPSPSPPPPKPSPPPPSPSPPPPSPSPPPPSPSPPPPSPSPPPPSPSPPPPSPSPPPPSPSPPPPSPSPPPPSPFPPLSPGSVLQLSCTCGYAASLTVGLVRRPLGGGPDFPSKITLTCSTGQVVRERVTTLEPVLNVTTPVCTNPITSGALAGGCQGTSVQYDKYKQPNGTLEQVVTKISGAGRPGGFSYNTNRCPAGQVMLGIQARRWTGGPGANVVFTSTLYEVVALCGNPFPARCQPPPPPRKLSPPPVKRPPPPKPVAPATVRQVCSCGHVRSFSVGFITKGGVKYASQIDMECSNGQIIRDRAPDVGVTWQNTTACTAANKVTTGPWKDACRAVNVRFVKVTNLEAVVGVVNAGRAGTGSYTRSCAATAGGIVGITFRRYVGPATLTSVLNTLNVVCANEVPSVRPQCGKSPPPKSPPPRKPPPPAKVARGWGDPHFDGFDGSRFDFHGVPGNWYELLGSKQPSMSLKTQVQRSVRLPQYTYMRAFELRINTTVIGVQLLEPLPSKPGIWRVVATANGVPVGSSLTLSNGIKIDRVAGDIGKFGTVKIDAGFIFVSCIQKWRPDRRELAEFYDVNIAVRNLLRLPVTGILGSSYENAVRGLPVSAQAAAPTANGLAPLPAPLEAKSRSDDELPA